MQDAESRNRGMQLASSLLKWRRHFSYIAERQMNVQKRKLGKKMGAENENVQFSEAGRIQVTRGRGSSLSVDISVEGGGWEVR